MTARTSSFRWKREAIFAMAGSDFPSFPGIADLARAVEKAGGPGLQDGQATKATRRLVDDLVAAGDLVKLRRDLYLNALKRPVPHPNEAAALMRPGAVVSLHTVLGETGVLNNPSRIVYAIYPNAGQGSGAKRSVDSDLAGYRFVSMSPALLEKGREEDRLDARASYPKATPERAIADWLYLVERRERSNLKPFATGQGAVEVGPPLDMDLDGLDMDRLRRCVEDLGVGRALDDFLSRKAGHDDDPDVQEMSGRFW